jgi:hypothetical protein
LADAGNFRNISDMQRRGIISKSTWSSLWVLHHIIIDVQGTPITIERDEEGNYRALVDPEKIHMKAR